MKNKTSARKKSLTKTESILPKFSTTGACSETTVDSGRRHMAIPFFFTVTQADQTRLIGLQGNSETINVGLGGVFFKVNHALQVGNKLELNLRLSPSQHVSASGWVVRSDVVSRSTYVNGTMVVRSVYSIGVKFQQLSSFIFTTPGSAFH